MPSRQIKLYQYTQFIRSCMTTKTNSISSISNTKNLDKSHVDIQNGILYNVLKQIRHLGNNTDPEQPNLIPVWACTVDPRQTKNLLKVFKTHYNDELNESLKHVKRMTKINELDIQAIICPFSSLDEKEVIIEKFSNAVEVKSFDIIKIPQRGAMTKEKSLQWSKIWPMVWRGNPNHQFLKTTTFDIEQEQLMITKLLDTLSTIKLSRDALVTIMARDIGNNKLEIQTIAINDGDLRPTKHSVMQAIDQIAKEELGKREKDEEDFNGDEKRIQRERGYLCTNMIVYTTHEPCVMCSMALVHSRIVRCTYLKPVTNGGGMESSYYLGDRDGLNWKFNIWRWLGEQELQKLHLLTGASKRTEY